MNLFQIFFPGEDGRRTMDLSRADAEQLMAELQDALGSTPKIAQNFSAESGGSEISNG